MTGSVTIVGSANFDYSVQVTRIPLPGETVVGAAPRRLLGGKGLNQAVAAARQGQRTLFVGSVGDDMPGKLIRDLLEVEHIDTQRLRVAEGIESGSAVVLVQPDGENCIVVSPGANASTTADAVAQIQDNTLTDKDVLLLQLEIPIDTVLRAARDWVGSVVLNAAPALEVPAELWQYVDVVVLNETELERFVPGAANDVFGAMATLQARSVITTLGSDGCAILTQHGMRTHIRPPHVTAIDTTGAGDVFCGVLAAALAAGISLTAAAARATLGAALSTQSSGSQSGPQLEELIDCELECEIDELK